MHTINMASSQSAPNVFEYTDFMSGVVTTVEFGEWVTDVLCPVDAVGVPLYRYAESVHIVNAALVVHTVGLKRGCFFEHTDRNTQTTTLWQLVDVIADGPSLETYLRAKRVVVWPYNELYISNHWDLFSKDRVGHLISDIARCIAVPANVEHRNPYWWNNGFVRLETAHLRPERQTEKASKGFFEPGKVAMIPNELKYQTAREELEQKELNPDAELSEGAKQLMQATIERGQKAMRDAAETSGDMGGIDPLFLTEADAHDADSEEARKRIGDTKATFDRIVDGLVGGFVQQPLVPDDEQDAAEEEHADD